MLGVIWKLFLLFEFSIFVFFKTKKRESDMFFMFILFFLFFRKKKQFSQNGNQIGH